MRLMLPVALAAASALFLAAPPARGQEFAYGYTYLWADDDGVDLEGYSTTTNNYGVYWVSVVVCAQIYDPSGEPLGDPQEDDEDGTGMDAYVSLFAEADGPGEYEAIGNHWFYGDYDGDADPPETYALAFVNQTPSVSDVDIDGVDYQNAPSGLEFAAGSNNTITFDGVDLGGLTPTITGCDGGWSITGWANTGSSVSTTLTVLQSLASACMIEIAVAGYLQIGIALSPPAMTVSLSPSSMNMSTGDTSLYVTTSVSPSTVVFTPTYSRGLTSDPNSNCDATIGFSGNGGTGSVNSTVSAGPAGCSGIFGVLAYVGTARSNPAQVTVPPQIMIQTASAEAGGQTAPGDASMAALLLVAENRFGDGAFGGGNTWQAVLSTGFVQDGTANGVQPELGYAAAVYGGTSTVTLPSGAECYWSPTTTQWNTIQSAYSSGATTEPANDGAPDCWNGGGKNLPAGDMRQIVVKASVGASTRGGSYAGAPAFVFYQLAGIGSPAVIQIP
jgi:hypothetical protein